MTRKKLAPPPPLTIEGHPSLIELVDLRHYSWRIRVGGRDRTGTAASPDDAIDQMRAIVRPSKVQ